MKYKSEFSNVKEIYTEDEILQLEPLLRKWSIYCENLRDDNKANGKWLSCEGCIIEGCSSNVGNDCDSHFIHFYIPREARRIKSKNIK